MWDGLVESGNARTIALKRVYQAAGQKSEDYKQFLRDNATQFGIPPGAIDGMDKPVLVRIRSTPVNRAEFARQANASTVAAMAPSEQAKSDSNRIDGMEDLSPDDNGDFSNAASRPFVRRFMARLPITEQAGMIDASGNLSTTGYARVRNAVLAKAYGDSPVLARMTESMDDNLRNVSRAMMMAAPKVAQMRSAVSAGNRFDADITPDLMAAVEELSRLKDEGGSVQDALAQVDLMGEQRSPEARQLLQFLSDNMRRPRRMADFISAYMDALDAAGDPNQGSLLGDTQAPAKKDLLTAAEKATQNEVQDSGSKGSGADQKAGDQTQRQPQDAQGSGRSTQANGGSKRSQAAANDAGQPGQGGVKAATPSLAVVDSEAVLRASAVQDAKDALDDLAKIASKHTRLSMLPESTPGLMPALVRLFSAAIRIVGSDLRSATKWVKSEMKSDPRLKPIWNLISNETYQKAALQALENPVAADQAEMFAQPVAGADQSALFDGPAGEVVTAPEVVNAAAKSEENKPLAPVVAEQNAIKTAAVEKKSDAKPGKIEDSGEVLEGARKLYAKNYAAKMDEGMGMDTAAVPLSKSWPEPDYQRLIDEGVDPWAVAMARAMRDEVPTKPSSWKLKGWVQKVESLRTMAAGVMSGAMSKEKFKTTGGQFNLADWFNKIDLYEAMGHAKSLKTLKFSMGEFGMYGGQTFTPAKKLWTINQPSTSSTATWSRGNWGNDLVVADTKEEALEKFRAWSEAQEAKAPAEAKATSFDIYTYRRKPGVVIVGKRISGAKSLDLKEFATVKEAREYKTAHQADLEKLLAEAKFEPAERRESNSPRVGADHRHGADVTSEQFRDTFGFRGEQFGASMPQGERQSNMNQAYDALMDLAGVIGIPPKALSLNGELGLAFGARGTGGKNPAAAHYERDTTGAVTPNRVVINLTRKNGAGSLAHEWFHGVDNYFARMRGEKAGMLTESFASRGEGVRPEMVAAFKQLMAAIQTSGMRERSKQLDKKRVKDYWSTGLEMAARAFESYVIAKLQDQNGSNDYLANIVPESMYAQQSGYPYPVMGEMPAIREAFDNFFDVVQTRETEQGVAMLSRGAGRFTVLEVPARTVEWLGFDSPLKLRADLAALASRHPEAYDDSFAVADDINFVLARPDGWYIHDAGKVTLFREGDGNTVPQVRIELERLGESVVVRSIYIGNRRQIATKMQKKREELARIGLGGNPESLSVADYLEAVGTRSLRPESSSDNSPDTNSDDTASGEDGQTRMSFAGRNAATADANALHAKPSGLSPQSVQDIAGAIKARWGNAPDIVVAANMADAAIPQAVRDYDQQQKSLGATGEPEGFIHRGKVYLVADQLATPSDVIRVLFHESLGHIGLRGAFGDSLKPILTQIVAARKVEVTAKATHYGLDMGKEADRLAAAEEVLAEMAQTKPELGFVKRAIAVIRNWLRANVPGFQSMKMTDADIVQQFILPARRFIEGKRGKRVKVRTNTMLSGTEEGEGVALSRSGAAGPATGPAVPGQVQETADARADKIIMTPTAGTAQPLDAIAKTLTRITGLELVMRSIYNGDAIRLMDQLLPRSLKLMPKIDAVGKSSFGETIKAGMVSDFGVPEAVIDQRSMMQGRQRVQLRKVGNLVDKLATLTRAESRVAYAWMNESAPDAAVQLMKGLPEASVAVLKEVQQMIDRLSQEAVRMGQLSPEAFERNRFAYLSRSYAKHTLGQTPGEKAGRARAISILGDQYKGRGLTEEAVMAQIQSAAPDWWQRKTVKGKADTSLKGEKLVRLERRAPSGERTTPLDGMEGKAAGKLLEVRYFPAGEPMPAKYTDWTPAGTFEVRDIKGEKAVLWRDFTKDEREKMGELDEVRFAVAKTLHAMVHDIEVGRYMEWLARSYAEKEGETILGLVVNASERYADTFKPGEWVRVPDSKIEGTAVLKYGKLAGRYLPGPVWNDLRQTVNGQFRPFGDTFAKILGLWKTSKTALSPAVHMNNVMSNFVMADWNDVTAGHVAKSLRILMTAHGRDGKGLLGGAGNLAARALGGVDSDAAQALLNRYADSGGDIGSWATNELANSQIEPMLEAMEKELAATGGNSAQAQMGIFSALQHAVAGRYGDALAAAKGSKPSKVIGTEAATLIDMYQSEDDVFRLAAWLKAKEGGATDMEAGKIARDSFLNYSINAPWVQALRNSALPFVSYSYRAIPMFLEVLGKKPHKLMKLMLLAGMVNAMGVMLSGGDDDEERKLLPEEKAGRIWGVVPKLIRMPWNDENQSPVYIDIRRFIPIGDVLDTGATNSAIPLLPVMMIGGPLAIIGEFYSNKSNFTDKPITLETDTKTEKTMKVLDHLYKALAPNIVILPGTYAFTNVKDTLEGDNGKGKTDAFGRELSMTQAVASSFGVKLGSYPADVLRKNEQGRVSAMLMEIGKNITQLKRERLTNRISQEEFLRKVRVQQEKKQKVEREFREKLN